MHIIIGKHKTRTLMAFPWFLLSKIRNTIFLDGYRTEIHSCKQKVVKDAKLNPHQSIALVNGCALQIDIIALHVHASLVFALFPYISYLLGLRQGLFCKINDIKVWKMNKNSKVAESHLGESSEGYLRVIRWSSEGHRKCHRKGHPKGHPKGHWKSYRKSHRNYKI